MYLGIRWLLVGAKGKKSQRPVETHILVSLCSGRIEFVELPLQANVKGAHTPEALRRRPRPANPKLQPASCKTRVLRGRRDA